MAIITSAITTLTDLNDAIISGTQPVNPTAGTLWIDSSKSPAVLKIYKNGAWVTQDLDLNSLDPNMAESIRNVVATVGNMSNDNLLDFQERQQIKNDLTEILGKVMLDTETVLPTVAQLDTLAKGSFYSTRRNALNAGIETSNLMYVDVATQYQNLKTYLESLTPIKPWNVNSANKDTNITVVKDTFRDKWLQYYLATEKLSLATTEKIKEVQDNLDGKIDEVSLRDKTEILSGNPVFTDKSDDAVVHVEVDGLSEQNAGSGKNLAHPRGTSFHNKNYPPNVATTYMVKNASIIVNGLVPSYSRISLFRESLKAGTYTVSWNQNQATESHGLSIHEVPNFEINTDDVADGIVTLVNYSYTQNTAGSRVYTFTTTKDAIINFSSYVGWGSSVTYNNLEFSNIQLETGTTATTFEPPAPSPDYPIAINSLGGGNLFDPNNEYYTNVLSSGLRSWKIQLVPNTSYTLETNIPRNASSLYDIFFDIYGVVPSSNTNGVAINEPRTITTDATGLVEISTRPESGYPFITGMRAGTYYAKLIGNNFDIVSSVGRENILLNSEIVGVNSNNNSLYPVEQTTLSDGDAKYRRITAHPTVGSGLISLYENISASNLTNREWEGRDITFSLRFRTNMQDANFSMSPWVVTNGQNIRPTGIVTTTKQEEWQTISMTMKNFQYNLVESDIIRFMPAMNVNMRGYYLDLRGYKIEIGDFSSAEWSPPSKEVKLDTPNPTIYKTNILLSEPLRSVGDVKDRLFLDTDGLWKVERNVGEHTFTDHTWSQGQSTGGWNASGETLPFYSHIPLNEMTNPARSLNAISSHFKTNFVNTSQLVSSDSEGFSMGYSSFGVIFRIKKSRLTEENSTGFRQWVKDNKVSNLYEMIEPIIETLSAEQQTKLNNIASFKGSNYVYTLGNVEPNLNAKFKSNMWYRMNVLGEKQVSGNRNWVSNGNLAYPLEKSLWSSYYKGTVKETVDISTETPPFRNALHIKQSTSGVAGIVDAVIWDGAEANVLSGQNISMATWIKYQNINTSELVMQVQVTGKKSDGTFVYDYPKVFSYTGTDLTWKRQTGTVKINLPTGAIEITRIVFRLGFAKSGTGEFWATGIQLETGNALGDWSTNPNDTEEELQKTEARLVLTEKEAGLSVKKGDVVREINVSDERIKIASDKIDITGAVTFSSFDTTTKNAIDDKSTKAEAQGYANDAVNNLEIGGRNLVIRNDELSGWLIVDGVYQAKADFGTIKSIIAVEPNETLYFTKVAVSGDNYWRWNLYNSSIAYSGRVTNDSNSFSWKVPSGVYAIKVSYPKESKPKIERGTKPTDWTPSPEDVEALISQAQTDATNAKTSAGTANQLLADLSNDNTLTPVEKKSVKKEWDVIVSEKVKIDVEANEYGITGAERTNYNTHYNSLNGYIPPLLTNLNANSNIVGVNFRGYFKNYYDARQDLLNAITSKAKTLADSAQGTADTVKGVISNFDSSIINANPIFLDWSGTLPTGYSSMQGATLSKVLSSNGMGNALKYTVPNLVATYLNPSLVSTFPFFNYITVETTFKLESGTIDGAGILFRFNATANVDHYIKLKDFIPNPTINKWYTITKVIKQTVLPSGFTGYQVYPMGGYSPLGTITAKVIQFDSLKTRQSTEQEINAYESNIMINDMSSDSKITPLEKVQLKKEWATIASERASLDAMATTYGVTTERTNMTNAYNTLNTVLNGTGGILLTMTTTSTVVGTTFRAQFDDYYEKRAILQRKVNEMAKSLADSANAGVGTINGKINNAVTTIDNTGVTVKDGSFYLQDDISDTKYSIVDLPNYIGDHSFESVDINYGDYTMVGNDMLYYPMHEGVHSFISGLQSIRGSDWWVTGDVVFTNSSYSNNGIKSSVFGRRSARVNSTSTLSNFYYDFTKKQTLTLSAFSKRVSTASAGALKMTVSLVNLSGSGASTTLASKSFSAVKTDNSVQRDSLTFTLPDNYDALVQGLWIRLEGTNSNYVYVDGIQLVDGTNPTVYNPEQGMINLTTGAYTARKINVNRIQFVSDNIYLGERGGGALDLANGDITGLNGLYFNDLYDRGGEGLLFLKSGKIEGSVNYDDYDTFGVLDGKMSVNGITSGDLLWSGAMYMQGSHAVTPTKKLSECPNGWCFVWSGYSGSVENYDWNYTYVHKRHLTRGGSGIQLVIAKGQTGKAFGSKYLYVNDAKVTGNDSNTGYSGNADMVLREVLAW